MNLIKLAGPDRGYGLAGCQQVSELESQLNGAQLNGAKMQRRGTASPQRSIHHWLGTVLSLFSVLLLASPTWSAPQEKGKNLSKTPKARSSDCCGKAIKTADASQPAKQDSKKNEEETKTASTRKDVLEPSQFFGLASFGYASAKACPEVMEKLFCYCGCDLTDNHTSLLDCFTSIHGVDCHICQEEAVLANKMHKDGVSILEIQKTIDEKYSRQYPFEQDTPTYKKYKSTRLYTSTTGSDSQVKFGTQAAGPEAPNETPASTNPKLKPGKEVGKCCAGGEHSKTATKKDDQSKAQKASKGK